MCPLLCSLLQGHPPFVAFLCTLSWRHCTPTLYNIALTTITWLHCLGLLLRVLVVLGLNATLNLIRPSSSSSSSSTAVVSDRWRHRQFQSPDTRDSFEAMMNLYEICTGMSRGCNHLFQILCRSVEGFRMCEGSNFAILPLLSRSPLTQGCATARSVMSVLRIFVLYFPKSDAQLNCITHWSFWKFVQFYDQLLWPGQTANASLH